MRSTSRMIAQKYCLVHSLRSELCSIDTRPSCAEDGNGLFPKQNCSQILIIVKFNKKYCGLQSKKLCKTQKIVNF